MTSRYFISFRDLFTVSKVLRSQSFHFYTRQISIILNKHLLVTTLLIILGSIIIKILFPSLELKFGTALPKAIEDYQSTYSKRKFKHYYL